MDAVVDTSVALKLVLSEAGSEVARRLFATATLVAPDFISIEIASGLLKYGQSRGRSSAAVWHDHEVALHSIARVYPTPPLLADSVALGLQLSHGVYDCIFLVLAEQLDLPLITADEPFLRKAVAAGYGRVRPLTFSP